MPVTSRDAVLGRVAAHDPPADADEHDGQHEQADGDFLQDAHGASDKPRPACGNGLRRLGRTRDVRLRRRSGPAKPELYRELARRRRRADRRRARRRSPTWPTSPRCIWQFVPELNWAGFYRAGRRRAGARPVLRQAGLHPHPARPGRVRHRGGARAQTQLVADVHAFPGHIACDAASRSELVVPVMREGAVVAVIDLDSPLPGALRCRGRGGDRGARRAGRRSHLSGPFRDSGRRRLSHSRAEADRLPTA